MLFLPLMVVTMIKYSRKTSIGLCKWTPLKVLPLCPSFLPWISVTSTDYVNSLLLSSLHLHIQTMRIFLLAIIGILLYNSNDARFFISDQLHNAAEIVRPDAQLNFRYWSWKPSTLLTVNLFAMPDLVVLGCQSRIVIIWERQPNTLIKFGHSSHPGKMISVS